MIKLLTNSNILDVKSGIICHQVNCKGVMGAGLAKQIKDKYPIVYREYLRSPMGLGYCQIVGVDDGLDIANLFGQNNYGRYGIQTSYSALGKALDTLFRDAEYSCVDVHIPYGIGCGLAGGEWNKVYNMIRDLDNKYNVNVFIHKF